MIARVFVGFGMNLLVRDDVKVRRRRDLATSADRRECAEVSKARSKSTRSVARTEISKAVYGDGRMC